MVGGIWLTGEANLCTKPTSAVALTVCTGHSGAAGGTLKVASLIPSSSKLRFEMSLSKMPNPNWPCMVDPALGVYEWVNMRKCCKVFWVATGLKSAI